MMLKRPSHSWWFDSHNSPRRSLWLQSTLADLDEKTKAMLKLIEEDADSFAQRAEMYYKKRPELVNMVEDFYRAHRSLAEKYEALRTETGTRSLAMQLGSPFFNKCPPRSLKATLSDKCSVASCDSFESEVSEVDDPDQEESQVGAEVGEDVSSEEIGGQGIRCGDNIASFEGKCLVQSGESESKGEIAEKNIALAIRPVCFSMRERELSDEVLKLREEIVQLKDDNAMQKAGLQRRDERRKCEAKIQWENEPEVFGMGTSVDDQMLRLRQELKQLEEELETQKEELSGRNEEKREAIRQLCLSMEMLKEENACLKKYVKDVNKKKSSFEFSKFRGLFTGKVFTKMFQPSIVAL